VTTHLRTLPLRRPVQPSGVARLALVALAFLAGAAPLAAQGTADDYRRALTLEDRYEGLVTGVVDRIRWDESGDRLTFRRSVAGGFEFLEVELASGRLRPIADPGAATPTPGGGGAGGGGGAAPSRISPDRTLTATIEDHNLVVRRNGAAGGEAPLFRTHDGTEGRGYTLQSVAWSPDSRYLAAYRVVPAMQRLVHYVESAPADQLQPRHFTRNYLKPGDRLAVSTPVVVDLETGLAREVANTLFPDAYAMTPPRWRDDGREFHFEYNQRGHDVYRILAVDPATARARAVVSEEPETFFHYSASSPSGSGKRYRHDLADGRELIWMSERSGWNHLYLYDGTSGQVKHAITSGDWVVRHVVRVDEERRQLWFAASGRYADQDPYFVHYYRVNFDGSGLTPLTEADGTHELTFSPDGRHYVVSWSRVDLPPVTELRRTEDAGVVAELGRGDASALLAAGWIPPEPFVAKGRDGVTDIWGIIVRPSTFDPSRRYPVIESIYAGPHDSHVPKAFSVFPTRGMLPQAELGFVVVMIDGMGTSNRSKAFHDVAWRNLGDAGFPDRILWHQAVAERHDWYDLDRVGIYGGSAGGQNAMGALLFHGDFYHAAVADNGCHDNRMDKIWWNELWMGKVGPHYDASSNVTNAHLLRGKLLLTVGELDTNVDPSSTYQVADALIRAGKEFEFLMIPGGEHARGPYHERKRFDFFVRHFLGLDPPDWNAEDPLG